MQGFKTHFDVNVTVLRYVIQNVVGTAPQHLFLTIVNAITTDCVDAILLSQLSPKISSTQTVSWHMFALRLTFVHGSILCGSFKVGTRSMEDSTSTKSPDEQTLVLYLLFMFIHIDPFIPLILTVGGTSYFCLYAAAFLFLLLLCTRKSTVLSQNVTSPWAPQI